MKAQIELPDFDSAIATFAKAIEVLTAEIRELKRSSPSEWLNATDFCKKYNISRPTLYKRAKSGAIETCNFGGDINRYRMTPVNLNCNTGGTHESRVPLAPDNRKEQAK